MAQYQALLLISYVLLFTISSSASPKNSSNPKTIVFQTTKDSSSKLHLTTIIQKTPHSNIKLVFHLAANGHFPNALETHVTPGPSTPQPGQMSFLKSEYYIHVENIKVNGLIVKIDEEILSVTNNGQGVTKISTSRVYTTMESSIYKAVANAFVKAVGNNVGRVPPVEPFCVCFNSSGGENLMVQVKKDIWCLGFVENLVTPVIPHTEIGTHQIEENLLQFDLDKSMLGFTSLHVQGVSCASLTSNLK
ncbi:hypothetical protein LIER_00666 [Lithospermum erythrorhizon]|uniref:Xylanase inhibitor C-terminal domain-containing protein n=1 Tax=Lithospermum erythrorhizon TaxID=34254 RepID=A0AAV3NLW5_LITER